MRYNLGRRASYLQEECFKNTFNMGNGCNGNDFLCVCWTFDIQYFTAETATEETVAMEIFETQLILNR